MAKGTILKVNKGIQKSFRKSQTEIQLAADEEKFIRSNMIHLEDKTSLKWCKIAAKVIVAEKQNVPAIRWSKCITAFKRIIYAESSLEVKPDKSKSS